MTESEYNQLEEFESLQLYDEDSPLCSSVDKLPRNDKDGAIWLSVHEVAELEDAQLHLQDHNLVPRGGIRYWDDERKNSNICAYFWKKR